MRFEIGPYRFEAGETPGALMYDCRAGAPTM
jgi:hypothetical protein